MVSNKKAKQTLAIVSGWDQYRAINKRLNNNVVVSLDADGWLFVFSKKVKGDNEIFPKEDFYKKQ